MFMRTTGREMMNNSTPLSIDSSQQSKHDLGMKHGKSAAAHTQLHHLCTDPMMQSSTPQVPVRQFNLHEGSCNHA
ncbi:MAG: hypothetical protein FRX49_07362 [Trebouxia sp. A1-2]|nr:MAG: hypothetical protein FRX49_07362 [Trebouxia sp. A1-2]